MNEKCVIIIDEALPVGKMANAAAILGITLGAEIPQAVGESVTDFAGHRHIGIVKIPVPILRASRDAIGSLRGRLYEKEFSDLITVDFSSTAQGCKTYDEFIDKMSYTEDLAYLGVALYGGRNKIASLTGSLPLLR